MTSNRYFHDTDNDEIQPGKISKKLRDALNLADNELPIWIYRMRALGYPPGWMKKAIVEDDIFDSADDGEGGNKRKLEDVKYDHSKLIQYPGFNMPIPEGVNDYCYYHSMPPLLSHQQLDFAKQHMNSFKSTPVTKRTRLSSPIQSSAPTSATKTNKDQNASLETSTNSCEEIKLISKGSPMPKPAEKPPPEHFSDGVVDLLHFENLPNTCGKFDSIRDLLKQI